MMTVPEVIKSVYGKPQVAAERLGVRPSSVSNWKAFGQFPARLLPSILSHAKEAGIEIEIEQIPSSAAPVRAQ